MQAVVVENPDTRCAQDQQELNGGGETSLTRKETDGHTGVEYDVVCQFSIQPRVERLTIALTRLREADWWRHYVMHIEGRSEMGAILGAVCGARPFSGCPVVGECRYVVLLSCPPDQRASRESVLREWFARLVAALDEASRHWLRAMEEWGIGKVVLGEAGVVVPPLSKVLEVFSPPVPERLRLTDGLWG
jgi:hypothetical protein